MEPWESRRDPRQAPDPAQQPLLQPDWPWRACLLSGGASRRMGRDKALLPHPEGGTWLERTLALLAAQGMPVTLLSRHLEHRQRAEALALHQQLVIEALDEPPPWEGPLRALARLMAHHPHQRLLLCPVDMPGLTAHALQELRAAADGDIVLAHDGERLQPLLGVYPSSEPLRRHLETTLAGGERRLQRWLEEQPHQSVHLPRQMLRNINQPADWELLRTTQPYSPSTTSLANNNPGQIGGTRG